MKHFLFVFLSILFIGCSKSNSDSESPIVPEEEPTTTIDLVSTSIIGETPFDLADQYIIHNKLLYVVANRETYRYGFSSKEWELLTEVDEQMAYSSVFAGGISFIRNGKWHLFGFSGMWVFDFETLEWNELPVITAEQLFNPKGFYVDDNLYFVSNANGNDKIYRYDFETNVVSTIGSFEVSGLRGEISQAVFASGPNFYTLLYTTDGLTVYRFIENFQTMEKLGSYKVFPLESGIAYLKDDLIIFGLGGSVTVDREGNYTQEDLQDQLYYFDLTEQAFGELATPFKEKRHAALSFTYDNEFYLLGGRTVINETITPRNTMEKLVFDYVEE